MANITKTVQTQLAAPQSLASNSVFISTPFDCSTKLAAMVQIRFGRRATTALTEGVEFRVEVSGLGASTASHWNTIASYKTAIAAAESEAVSGTVSSGTNVITVASTTNLARADIVYIDNSTIANSEWGRVKSISTNASITIEDNLVNAQTGSTIYDQAEILPPFDIDLRAVKYLRVVVDGSNTGQAIAFEIDLITADSIG